MNHISRFSCKWLDKKEIWAKADELASRFWPENDLPIDIELIIEKVGLDVIPVKNLRCDCDIDAFLSNDLTAIVVDHDCYMIEKFRRRTRFSLAHELGHLILHSEIYHNLPFHSAEEWKNYCSQIPEDEYKKFEWQAHEFAGRLLVPHASLSKEFLQSFKPFMNNEQMMQFLELDPDLLLSRLISPSFRTLFDVSEDVIIRRLKSEGIWPPKR